MSVVLEKSGSSVRILSTRILNMLLVVSILVFTSKLAAQSASSTQSTSSIQSAPATQSTPPALSKQSKPESMSVETTQIQGIILERTVLASTALERTVLESTSLVEAAIERTKHTVRYDGAYMSIGYPNGDVPENIGVCTDVIIRSYRSLNVDLQVLVHEDMKANFSEYPSNRIWGLSTTDKNIDHRRVPNLQTFFTRHGESLLRSNQPHDYSPGDIVTWMLPGNLPHIGIVSDRVSETSGNPLIVHNIGQGPKLEDMLFDYKITGRYRYLP